METLMKALRGVAVFADLPAGRLQWFAERCEQVWLEPGEANVREGDSADEMWVVLEGEIRARKENGASDQPVFVMKAGA
ncbi:MAG TPA: hypothetical protein DEH78_01850, partial [Solibacterales bacterium]|nr:hypothetical protein [Bryobacterales bacterium]